MKMYKLLKKLGLIDNLIIELEMDEFEVIDTIKRNIDSDERSSIWNPFTNNKKEYQGKISYGRFEIRRNYHLFDFYYNFSKIIGNISKKDNKVIIDCKISAFHGYLMFTFFICLIFNLFAITMITTNSISIISILSLIIFSFFFILVPIIYMNRSVKKMKYDFERDIYFMIKNKNALQQQV